MSDGARWVERLIADAQARGELDDLPGHGKPIDGLEHEPDELWWVRRWLQREQVEVVPPGIALRRDVESLDAQLLLEPTEAAARVAVEQLNERILEANRVPLEGPPSAYMPRDVEAALARRREALAALGSAAPAGDRPPGPEGPPPRPGLLDRLRGRRRRA